MYVDTWYRIAVQLRSQVYALPRQLVQQLGVDQGGSMNFDSWLKTLADQGGSDLYLTTGAPPVANLMVNSGHSRRRGCHPVLRGI